MLSDISGRPRWMDNGQAGSERCAEERRLPNGARSRCRAEAKTRRANRGKQRPPLHAAAALPSILCPLEREGTMPSRQGLRGTRRRVLPRTRGLRGFVCFLRREPQTACAPCTRVVLRLVSVQTEEARPLRTQYAYT